MILELSVGVRSEKKPCGGDAAAAGLGVGNVSCAGVL